MSEPIVPKGSPTTSMVLKTGRCTYMQEKIELFKKHNLFNIKELACLQRFKNLCFPMSMCVGDR